MCSYFHISITITVITISLGSIPKIAFIRAGLVRKEGQEQERKVPVTEGKKMPTSNVKEVVMSANTYG